MCGPVLQLVDELTAGEQWCVYVLIFSHLCSSKDFSSKYLGPVTANLYCDLVSKQVVEKGLLETMIPANDEVT